MGNQQGGKGEERKGVSTLESRTHFGEKYIRQQTSSGRRVKSAREKEEEREEGSCVCRHLNPNPVPPLRRIDRIL